MKEIIRPGLKSSAVAFGVLHSPARDWKCYGVPPVGSTATLTHDVTTSGAHLKCPPCSTSSRPAMALTLKEPD